MPQYDKFIDNPNLPENDVTLAAVGKDYLQTVNSLENKGIHCLKINRNNSLPDYIGCHADMNIFHFGGNKLFCEKGITAGEYTSDFLIELISESTASEYPNDCLLNAVIIDDKLICNINSVSKNILRKAEINGLKIFEVNQGYTKCSICVLNENAVITDDISIYKSIQNYFNDVLLISKGSVRLDSKEYGFIGGATGKLGKYKLAFNGRLESHSDHNMIIDLLEKYNIEPIELSDDALTDIGSIIPLKEKL